MLYGSYWFKNPKKVRSQCLVLINGLTDSNLLQSEAKIRKLLKPYKEDTDVSNRFEEALNNILEHFGRGEDIENYNTDESRKSECRILYKLVREYRAIYQSINEFNFILQDRYEVGGYNQDRQTENEF